MSEFVGNPDLIKLLRLSIMAAKARNLALPHILLKGPAGTGKTTLAEAIAREFETEPVILTPNTASKNENLRKVFQQMPGEGYDDRGNITGTIRPTVVFIDECHQLGLTAQENLGIAMQDWRLPVRMGAVDTFEWLPRFTLIGATTLPGRLSKPFLDRFKIQSEFETYSHAESIIITHLHAKKQGFSLEEGVADAVSRRARGVARLIVRFLDRLADASVVAERAGAVPKNRITMDIAETVFKQFLKVDDRGLTRTDIKILLQLAQMSDPVGVEALSVVTNEDSSTIQNTIEPFLIQEGLIARTRRGRVLTPAGRRYLATAGYLDQLQAGPDRRILG